jgi:type III secretory pathway component EscS
MMEGNQLGTLMLIFGVGYLAVFGVFVLLYSHAYRKQAALELNDLELFDTRNSIQESALNCGIAVLSICIVLVAGPRYAGVAGLSYMLAGVAMGANGTIMGKRRRRLEKEFAE